jgi:hypothetical protein
MEIVSSNPKILDELFDELNRKNDVEKVQESKDDGGMLGILATVKIVLGIGISLIKIYEFLEKKFPDWKIVFEPLTDNEIGMTFERYEALTDKAKEEIHSKFKIYIIKK